VGRARRYRPAVRICHPRPWVVSALILLATGCERRQPPPAPAAANTPVSSSSRSTTEPPTASVPSASLSAAGSIATADTTAPLVAIPDSEFAQAFHDLSEPGEYFFSDNTISNETSYLQVARSLERRVRPGGAYLGVGPEQNFTYIALTHPKIAFIIDIRRDNALLHLLYKAIFHQAKTRTQFVAMLLGRPYDPTGEPEATAGVRAVLAHAQKRAADEDSFRNVHRSLFALIEGWGISLSPRDVSRLEAIHRSFFEAQLALKFELREANGRKYPTLEELLEARDPAGSELGFLATHEAFLTVRRLERLNRVIPVVGDFAGTHALQSVAIELKRRRIEVGSFYVSNVEQYLFEPAKWSQYVTNIESLPLRDDALFVRCYLDQGRRHPQQLEGHRTTTLLMPLAGFLERQKQGGYRTFWQLATDS